MSVTRDNGGISTYRLTLDDSQSRLQLGDTSNPLGSLTFHIVGEDVLLAGDLNGEPVRMRFVRQAENPDFLVRQRGFHWISEFPFNR